MIQSSNSPLVIRIDERNLFSSEGFRASLWSESARCLKRWTADDIQYIDGDDSVRVVLPLKQSETITFPAGILHLEMKWIKSGVVRFTEDIKISVVKRNDKTILEGVE